MPEPHIEIWDIKDREGMLSRLDNLQKKLKENKKGRLELYGKQTLALVLDRIMHPDFKFESKIPEEELDNLLKKYTKNRKAPTAIEAFRKEMKRIYGEPEKAKQNLAREIIKWHTPEEERHEDVEKKIVEMINEINPKKDTLYFAVASINPSEEILLKNFYDDLSANLDELSKNLDADEKFVFIPSNKNLRNILRKMNRAEIESETKRLREEGISFFDFIKGLVKKENKNNFFNIIKEEKGVSFMINIGKIGANGFFNPLTLNIKLRSERLDEILKRLGNPRCTKFGEPTFDVETGKPIIEKEPEKPVLAKMRLRDLFEALHKKVYG